MNYKKELNALLDAGKWGEVKKREEEIKAELHALPKFTATYMTSFVGSDKENCFMEYHIEVRDYNPCYDRVLVPFNPPEGFVGPMYDGQDHLTDKGENLKVMSRFETQKVYDMMSM